MILLNDASFDRWAGVLVTITLFIVTYILDRRSKRIQKLMIFKEFREPVLKFSDEVIETMSEVEGLCECNPAQMGKDFFKNYNHLITKISALRDKGRLLIPNLLPLGYDKAKSSAYQGYRHDALDCLTAAYYAAISINSSMKDIIKRVSR